jgi:hypothetical protein
MKIDKLLRGLLIILMTVFMSSCGSGGGSGSPISGIWIGTFTSNANHSTYNVTGIIDEYGVACFPFTSTSEQYSGAINISGNSFSSTGTAYAPFGYAFPDGSHVGPASISGMFTVKGAMNGTYIGVGDTRTFSLTYSTLYERPSSLEEGAGTWTAVISGYTVLLTIDWLGNIMGSSGSGCTYLGNMGIIDSSYNAYSVNLSINNCGVENGTYSGLAALTDNSVANNALLIAVSNSSFSFVAPLSKV